jgi:hypothetical protein
MGTGMDTGKNDRRSQRNAGALIMDIEELIENFSFFENWEEKYQYVIDFKDFVAYSKA